MEKQFTFRWEVDQISKLSSRHRYSPFHHHYGIPCRRRELIPPSLNFAHFLTGRVDERVWEMKRRRRLLACTDRSKKLTNNVRCFGLYFCCEEDAESKPWSVGCTWKISLLHRTDPDKSKHITGFVKDDKIIVEGSATILNVHCISQKPILDFSQPSPDADNIALKLDDGTLYGCRRYLMWHSKFFASLFMGNEMDKEYIEINDVKVDDFNELLQVIFPSERSINEDSYSAVLKLANRFQIECALDAVEKFLMKSKKVMTATKMLLAEQYGMETLMKQCMNSLKTLHDVKALESATEYSQMSVTLKVSLLAKVFELLKPNV